MTEISTARLDNWHLIHDAIVKLDDGMEIPLDMFLEDNPETELAEITASQDTRRIYIVIYFGD